MIVSILDSLHVQIKKQVAYSRIILVYAPAFHFIDHSSWKTDRYKGMIYVR